MYLFLFTLLPTFTSLCILTAVGGEGAGEGKINLASHEYFPSDRHQSWFIRARCFGFYTHSNPVRMSRISLWVVFFLAAAA